MAVVTDNAAEVVGELTRFVGGLGFHGPGRYRTLGEDVREAVAQAQYDRTALGQRDVDGQPLRRLADSTLRAKARRGFPDTILVATGAMLSPRELRGEAEITRGTVDVEYGTSEETRLRAEYAMDGSRKRKRPPRRFLGLDDRMKLDLELLITEGLDAQAAAGGCV